MPARAASRWRWPCCDGPTYTLPSIGVGAILSGVTLDDRDASHITNQDTSSMDIKTESSNGTLIAKAEGRIDGVNARDFEEAMKAAISSEYSTVIIDLEGLSYISSAGLRVILLIAKTLRKRNAELVLCSLSNPIREVFEISGFDKIIPVHASREQALASVGS